jgi:hypothetical protein
MGTIRLESVEEIYLGPFQYIVSPLRTPAGKRNFAQESGIVGNVPSQLRDETTEVCSPHPFCGCQADEKPQVR